MPSKDELLAEKADLCRNGAAHGRRGEMEQQKETDEEPNEEEAQVRSELKESAAVYNGAGKEKATQAPVIGLVFWQQPSAQLERRQLQGISW
jgi:hypothetical protein